MYILVCVYVCVRVQKRERSVLETERTYRRVMCVCVCARVRL